MAAVPSIGRATRIERPVARGADAAGDLYERYSAQIFGYCLHQLGSREEAEDAVQTTFMNAFRGLSRGIVPELESAWLFKIAHNVCLSRRRSSWRRGPRRGAEQLRGASGGRSRPRICFGRADPLAGRPRGDAGEPAARDPAARVAGTDVPRDLCGARSIAGRRRDTDLSRPALARAGAGAGRRERTSPRRASPRSEHAPTGADRSGTSPSRRPPLPHRRLLLRPPRLRRRLRLGPHLRQSRRRARSHLRRKPAAPAPAPTTAPAPEKCKSKGKKEKPAKPTHGAKAQPAPPAPAPEPAEAALEPTDAAWGEPDADPEPTPPSQESKPDKGPEADKPEKDHGHGNDKN